MAGASTNLLTAPQVARRLQVSKRSVYRLAKAGELRSVRVGCAVRYAEEDVAAYIQKLRGAQPQAVNQ